MKNLFTIICLITFLNLSGKVFNQTLWNSNYTNSSIIATIDYTFVNNTTGFAYGTLTPNNNGFILKTTNSGVNWGTPLNIGSGAVTCISFPTENTGYASGWNQILKTTNAGNNWFSVNKPTSAWLSSCYFIDENTGLVCGDGGALYRTINGGNNWTYINISSSGNINSIGFSDNNNGWIAGSSGMIKKTTNGGINWFNQFSQTTNALGYLRVIDGNTIYCMYSGINTGAILKTSNGGQNWNTLYNFSYQLINFYFPTESIVYTAGLNNGNLYLQKSTNSGINWNTESYQTNGLPRALYFIDANTGFIGLEFGTFLKRTDISTSFSDDFNDGNFTENPEWVLTPGGTGCQSPGIREVINGEFHLADTDSYGCGHSTMIESNVNIQINNSTQIKFDVNPVFSDVRNGAGDTHEEYPAILELTMRDSINNLFLLRFCYNYRGGSSLTQSNYIRLAFPFVPQNVWQRNQKFRLNDYFQNAKTIEKIRIGADGWDYESYFDNIKINSFEKNISVKVIPQGFYNSLSNRMRMKDSVEIILREQNSPYNITDSFIGIIDSISYNVNCYSNIQNGMYYIVVKHRNCIETWSSVPVLFNSNNISYDFTTLKSQSYGNNLIQIDNLPVKYGIYSGDVNQDGIIDISDISSIENDAVNFITGYAVTDLDGDKFVDISDISIADNHAFNFISLIRP